MAQYAVLIHAEDGAHDPGNEAPATQEWDDHADQLDAEGVMTGAWALTPRTLAWSINAEGTRAGTFVDSPTVVAGFYLLEAPSLETALAIAGQNPIVRSGGGVEVRPVHSGGPLERADSAVHQAR